MYQTRHVNLCNCNYIFNKLLSSVVNPDFDDTVDDDMVIK